MAKDNGPIGKNSGHQINFKCPASLYRRLVKVADVYGVDLANCVRLILSKNIHLHEEEAANLRAKAAGGAEAPDEG